MLNAFRVLQCCRNFVLPVERWEGGVKDGSRRNVFDQGSSMR